VPYVDRTLHCVECGQPFIFTAGDQEFHASKGFTNEPKRCRDCRMARRERVGGASGGSTYSAGATYSSRPPREMFPAICAQCGVETQVPFQPRGDRPVYCNECFHKVSGSYSSRRY
jgi:CxxC-x17-CxxC domain-containing protein